MQIHAEEWSRELFEKTKDKVLEQAPYEIQQLCFDLVKDLDLTPDQKRLVSTCAYDNGIEASEVLPVLAVVLRDKLLEHTNQQVP